MGNYMDKSFLAVDGVILTYSGKDKTLKIPSKLMDMDIVRLGDGSFMEAPVNRVIIPEGIKEIGKNTFSYCPALSEVELPGSLEGIERLAFSYLPSLTSVCINELALSKQQFSSLKQTGIPAGSTKFIITDVSSVPLFMQIVNSATIKPARFIPHGMSRLFVTPDSDTISEVERCRCFNIGISGEEQKINEFSTALLDVQNPIDQKTELLNDERLKKDTKLNIEKTMVFFIEETNYSFSNDIYYVRAEISVGYHFWHSIVPIMHEGKQYYLYRRNYLNRDSDYKYARIDVAILTGKGLLKDKAEAEEVYAKYRLLSIL